MPPADVLTHVPPQGGPTAPPQGGPTAPPTVLKMRVRDYGLWLDYRIAAVLLVSLWGLNYTLVGNFTTGLLAGVGSVPLWLPILRDYRFGRALVGLGGLAIICGVLWAIYLSGGRPYTASSAFAQLNVALVLVTGIGLLLWARTKLSSGTIAMIIGTAMLVSRAGVLSVSPNAWKFEIGTAVTLIALGAVASRTWWIQSAVLVALIGVGITNDSRSYAMICFLGGGLLLLQRLGVRPRAGWRGALLLGTAAAVLGIVLSALATTLVLHGAFGEQLAQRTESQVERAGSALSGGRPEWSGTVGLMANRPLGFGFGAVPTYEDVWAAREGLAAVGIGTSSAYPDNYMFRGAFKLHSVMADLWSQTGIAGLLFAGALIVAVISSVSERLRLVQLSALTGVLAAKCLWDIGFSPMQSTGSLVAIAIGLLLLLKEPEVAAAKVEPPVPTPLAGPARPFTLPV